MFSDQYKKDNEKLVLDPEFLEQLKINMRNEKARLEDTPVKSAKTLKEERKDTRKQLNSSRWKHTLPIALSACAALALIINLPNMSPSKKDESTTEFIMDTAVAEQSESIEAPASGTFVGSSESQTESMAEAKTEAKAEEREEEKADASDSGAIDRNGIADTESTESEDGAAQNKLTFKTPAKITLEQEKATVDFSLDPFDLTVGNDYIPTDPETLADMSARFQCYERGADPVSLDYAYNGRLILHDYYGCIIYDYEKEELLRIVNLPSRIGDYTTQGDHTLSVSVFEGGNYVLFDYNATDEDGNSICYLYDVQSDIMAKIKREEYESLKVPKLDSHLDYNTSSFDGLIPAGNRSDALSKLEGNEHCILFYQSSDDTSIASLSACIIIPKSAKTREMEKRILPIFGSDAINELVNQGYSMDGILR